MDISRLDESYQAAQTAKVERSNRPIQCSTVNSRSAKLTTYGSRFSQSSSAEQSTKLKQLSMPSCSESVDSNHYCGNVKFRQGRKFWRPTSVQSRTHIQQPIVEMPLLQAKGSIDHQQIESRTESFNRESSAEVACFSDQDIHTYLSEISNLDFDILNDETLLEIITKDKNTALAFQLFIKVAWHGQFASVTRCVLNNLDLLTIDPLGNYFLQVLVSMDLEIMKRLVHYCQENFGRLKDNEFGSRVMQCLIQHSNSFRQFTLSVYNQFPHWATSTMPAVFISANTLTYCEYEHQYQFALYLLGRSKVGCASKYLKRLIVSLLSVCSDQNLHQIYSTFELNKGLQWICKDRYLVFILLGFLKRNFHLAIELVTKTVASNLRNLSRTRFFKLLVGKSLAPGFNPSISAAIHRALNKPPSLNPTSQHQRQERHHGSKPTVIQRSSLKTSSSHS
mgnify:CR=1 FL=1